MEEADQATFPECVSNFCSGLNQTTVSMYAKKNSPEPLAEALALVSLLSNAKKHAWLDENLPLLTKSGFRAALTLRYSERSILTAEAWHQYREIRTELIREARSQMELLALKAQDVVAGSEFARAAIGELLLGEGPELPEELRLYGQELAARAILKLAPRILPKTLVANLVLGLTRNVEMPESPRIILLDALQVLLNKWRKYGAPSDIKSPSELILETLELELLRLPQKQSKSFIVSIFKVMADHPNTMFVPLLNILTVTHEHSALRKLAKNVLLTINTSLEQRWNSVRKDELSNLKSRANRLSELNFQQPESSVCIQTIFNNTKSIPIETALDPRAIELKKLLSHADASVQIAVCWAVYGQGSYSTEVEEYLGGINALLQLALPQTLPGIHRDALALLSRLQKDFPDAAEQIYKATASIKQTASEERNSHLISLSTKTNVTRTTYGDSNG